ncbi:MAG: efflux RND transporter periplasmic adaptor subunit, partial [Nitrospirae bacterium]|nr:efflux RND transporter periplasmic adaptor subunit [Nitrospirota bacterium]
MINLRKIVLIISILILISCSKDKTELPKKGKMAVPIVSAQSIEKDVPVIVSAIGQVDPYSIVTITSMITGQLKEIHFREGDVVKKGQLLFTIDPRSAQAALELAQANYARDLSLLENAKRDAERYKKLSDMDYVAKSQYDQYQTNADSLAATLKSDIAAIDNAKIQLNYCSIYSPLTGVTGKLLLNVGNLLKANDDTKPMITINQIQPIYVSFSLPQQYLSDIRKYSASGKLLVDAVHPQAAEVSDKGSLSLVDNSVDYTTGTIHLRAVFNNSNKTLWPGEFVKVKLYLTTKKNAVVVPSAAVLSGQSGQIIYVIKEDQSVEIANVTTGISNDNETVIESG